MTPKETSQALQDSPLANLRTNIDSTDRALIALLAERFRLTQKIGELKRDMHLPAIDPEREAKLFAVIKQRAEAAGLNPVFTAKLWRVIIDEVVTNHSIIKQKEGIHE